MTSSCSKTFFGFLFDILVRRFILVRRIVWNSEFDFSIKRVFCNEDDWAMIGKHPSEFSGFVFRSIFYLSVILLLSIFRFFSSILFWSVSSSSTFVSRTSILPSLFSEFVYIFSLLFFQISFLSFSNFLSLLMSDQLDRENLVKAEFQTNFLDEIKLKFYLTHLKTNVSWLVRWTETYF